MPRKNDSGLYEPPKSIHFNVKYKGAGLDSRVLASHIRGCSVTDI